MNYEPDEQITDLLSGNSRTSPIEYAACEETPRYPVRERKPKEFPDFVTYQTLGTDEEPTSVEEALHEDKCKWDEPKKYEYNSLLPNNSWERVDLPKGKKTIKL